MSTLFSPHDREVVANRASARIAQQADAILNAAEQDLFKPGRGRPEARVAEAFRLVGQIIDDVLAHDQQEAEFQLGLSKASRQHPELNPFSEEREHALHTRVMAQLCGLVTTVLDPHARPKLARLLRQTPGNVEAMLNWQTTEAGERIRMEYKKRRGLIDVAGAGYGQRKPGFASPDQTTPPTPLVKPRWDRERSELSYDTTICKSFRQPAKNQILILESFEEMRWPPRIDDPLPGGACDARQRLADAVRQLNKNPCLQFELDGTSKGVLWKPKVP